MPIERPIYGLAAEFASPEALIKAAQMIHAAGYRKVEGYSPYPIPEVARALGFHRTRVPLLVFIGGITGAIAAYFMMWYANVISYPWNIGGKPPNSWPAFIPISFELMVLGASLMALFGMLALNGLPMPYHPLFNLPSFELASQTRFFICIESSDPKYDRLVTWRLLAEAAPEAMMEVPW